MDEVSKEDLAHLVRDKYDGNESAVTAEDLERLAAGEPLAYVIGWAPFLGLRIELHSRPLIPRAETEWWTEQLIEHLTEQFGDSPFTLLDLCAGSGVIGLAVLARCPHAQVYFAELMSEHIEQIRRNIELNSLDASRAVLAAGDLFAPLALEQFDIIASNPPYIPRTRSLPPSVTDYEPREALYGGEDGLELIRRIVDEAPAHLARPGELWMECDIANIEVAQNYLLRQGVPDVEIRTDPYERPRILVAYYP